MSLDTSLVPETLLNAQRIIALPENPDHLPAVDWKKLGAPDNRIPHIEETPSHQADSPLPKADVVVMTWTLAEWAAMNQVLTNRRDPLTPDQLHSHEWQEGWLSYQRDYYQIYQYMVDVSKTFQGGAPSLYSESWGSFRQVRIGDLNVLLVKSGMHLAQDGSQLPLIRFVEQICQEAQPSLLLSIGTGGGVRSEDALGSALITNQAYFHCLKHFANARFNHSTVTSSWQPDNRYLPLAQEGVLHTRGPQILPVSPQYPAGAHIDPDPAAAQLKVVTEQPIITTDTFLFGTTDNGLEKLGCMVEMDDAVVGMACQQQKTAFGFVRNVSDPVINGALPASLQDSWAGYIYREQGLYTSYNGALATWALLAAEADRKEKGQ
ncbi:hypothetical protein A3754_11330 [Alcanivorax sp. HI0083]|uniref:phosphorylase family protein n=3 Tax=Alcanivorax TaxID=59753 RepID=UPI0007B8BB51|nr:MULTISPECIES: hypothetical protein [unclassified Alcanivorax]KZY30253.1 hypothetical protein A3730_06575 [Alcanivorax sp. HI0044]KZZ26389.1 hypothetical protein A3754_11330 [Alcanivorax sp. HI0083]PHR67454.1 MAG: hypothetical protein COA55_06145 [Alcanivorax sp.]